MWQNNKHNAGLAAHFFHKQGAIMYTVQEDYKDKGYIV